jgi:hypothetical protein
MLSMCLSASLLRLCPVCGDAMDDKKITDRAFEAGLCGVGTLHSLLEDGICPYCFCRGLRVDSLKDDWRRWCGGRPASDDTIISKSVSLPFDLI